MSENTVVVESTRRRLSAIWLVPMVALILGVWLAVDAYLSQGPMVTIRFADAEGIQAEKTLVKIRNVTIGLVSSVRLAGDRVQQGRFGARAGQHAQAHEETE